MGMQIGLCVTLSVTNIGGVAAKAVPQLYLKFPSTAGHPRPVLKGFQKTGMIEKGGHVEVTFQLGDEELSYYDVGRAAWVKEADGPITAYIGESSADLQKEIVLRRA